MNKELEQFLDYIVKPESVEDTQGYVTNQIILGDGLTLCCNYHAGSAAIVGTAWGKPITIMYNHFYYQTSFIFRVDGHPRVPPISLEELKQYFTAVDIANKPQTIEVKP